MSTKYVETKVFQGDDVRGADRILANNVRLPKSDTSVFEKLKDK